MCLLLALAAKAVFLSESVFSFDFLIVYFRVFFFFSTIEGIAYLKNKEMIRILLTLRNIIENEESFEIMLTVPLNRGFLPERALAVEAGDIWGMRNRRRRLAT